MSHDRRHDLLVRFFAHHDRPADFPEQRAVALGAWLDAAITASLIPDPGPNHVIIAACIDIPASRRKTVRAVVAVPDVGPVTCVIDLRAAARQAFLFLKKIKFLFLFFSKKPCASTSRLKLPD